MVLAGKNLEWYGCLYYFGYRFYDPNWQKWITRDPLGEEGGLNVFRFVANSPVDNADSLGLAEIIKNASGGTSVSVENCEIVIYIGHGNPNNDPSFVPPPKGGCGGAAGFVGCYADQINTQINKRRLGPITGSPKVSQGDQLWAGRVSPYQNSPDWNKAIDDIRKGVSGEIAAMLKKKCSKTVKVTVTNGEQTNSQTFSTAPTDWQWPINPK